MSDDVKTILAEVKRLKAAAVARRENEQSDNRSRADKLRATLDVQDQRQGIRLVRTKGNGTAASGE